MWRMSVIGGMLLGVRLSKKGTDKSLYITIVIMLATIMDTRVAHWTTDRKYRHKNKYPYHQ